MKKPAFTMIELVFVIVVLGILAALAIPRLDRDLKQEATDNMLSAIRYTQHLALIDDKTNPSINWQLNLWNIKFETDGSFYTISSDNGVPALDPINGKAMDSNSPNTLIGKKYSVIDVNLTGGCTSGMLAFDNLGRPFKNISDTNNYSEYMSSPCNISVTFSKSGITPLNLTVAAETGHVSVVPE